VKKRKIRLARQSGAQPTREERLRAKRLEDIGYATLSMPDHMVGGAPRGRPDPRVVPPSVITGHRDRTMYVVAAA
jgi:hypothetical protein